MSSPSIIISGAVTAIATSPTTTAIYIAGYESLGVNEYRWRIEKRDKSGVLDSVFGSTAGFVTSHPSSATSGDDEPNSIVIDQTNNAMYVAGFDSVSETLRLRVEKRFLDSGNLDTSFATNGVYISSANGYIWSIALDPVNPYLYAAGFDSAPGYNEWRVEKIVK